MRAKDGYLSMRPRGSNQRLDAGALNDVICSTAPPKNCFLHLTVELIFITVKMFGNWASDAVGGAGGRELEQKIEGSSIAAEMGPGGVQFREDLEFRSAQDEGRVKAARSQLKVDDERRLRHLDLDNKPKV
ncbi:hypothetical protein DFH09DRAFT_1094621 [Mycena vulgaris]|nr:hypothetical protein DFH09DRAFT_1094621 [Mycena vulgaris]